MRGSISLHHHVDQRARREVLAGAGLHLGRVLLQQALVDRALHVHADADPGLVVDQRDHALELGRVGELVLRLAEDGADQALLLGQRLQRVAVLQFQVVARQRPQLRPAPLGRDDRGLAQQLGALLVHLQEQQEGDLLDVVAVADALVAQDVGVVPDLGDEAAVVVVVGAHAGSWVLFLLPRLGLVSASDRSAAMQASSAEAGSSASS